MSFFYEAPLISFEEFQRLDRGNRLATVLDALDAEPLLHKLERQRRGRRDDYPIRVVWNSQQPHRWARVSQAHHNGTHRGTGDQSRFAAFVRDSRRGRDSEPVCLQPFFGETGKLRGGTGCDLPPNGGKAESGLAGLRRTIGTRGRRFALETYQCTMQVMTMAT